MARSWHAREPRRRVTCGRRAAARWNVRRRGSRAGQDAHPESHDVRGHAALLSTTPAGSRPRSATAPRAPRTRSRRRARLVAVRREHVRRPGLEPRHDVRLRCPGQPVAGHRARPLGRRRHRRDRHHPLRLRRRQPALPGGGKLHPDRCPVGRPRRPLQHRDRRHHDDERLHPVHVRWRRQPGHHDRRQREHDDVRLRRVRPPDQRDRRPRADGDDRVRRPRAAGRARPTGSAPSSPGRTTPPPGSPPAPRAASPRRPRTTTTGTA